MTIFQPCVHLYLYIFALYYFIYSICMQVINNIIKANKGVAVRVGSAAAVYLAAYRAPVLHKSGFCSMKFLVSCYS